MIIMKEYGGYLPLERSIRQEYYNEGSYNLLRLNSGRTAISVALNLSSAKKVYIPVYNCISVENELKKRSIAYEFYNIDRDFLPVNVSLEKDEYLLYINYFGITPKECIEQIKKTYVNVIFDNTQAFFARPVLDCYNCYSCRKFIGVSDGSYLIKKDIDASKLSLKKDYSYKRAEYLLKCIDCGTNAAYSEHLLCEDDIAQDILEMSNLTRYILSSIDYEAVKYKRLANFNYTHKILCNINELNIHLEEQIPMVYPLLIKNSNLRKILVDNKIYVPQWWKWIINSDISNDWEKYLSEFLIPIPIDQRYNQSDMDYILKIILDNIR